MIDPNPTKLPSTQKNVIRSNMKFFIFKASTKLVTKLARFCSCIATRLGGFFGFSRMMKKSGTVMQVIHTFWITIRSISFSLIYYGFVLSTPEKITPDIVNAKMLPEGMASPQSAVTSVRSLSGNHLLQIRLIAALNIGYAKLIQAWPTKIGQNFSSFADKILNQAPVRNSTQAILITIYEGNFEYSHIATNVIGM
jgi:hypothetical protein